MGKLQTNLIDFTTYHKSLHKFLQFHIFHTHLETKTPYTNTCDICEHENAG